MPVSVAAGRKVDDLVRRFGAHKHVSSSLWMPVATNEDLLGKVGRFQRDGKRQRITGAGADPAREHERERAATLSVVPALYFQLAKAFRVER